MLIDIKDSQKFKEFKKNKDKEEYKKIRGSVMASLERYYFGGMSPGGYVRGVLENDLLKALSHSSPEHGEEAFTIAKFAYNVLPARAWGSKENVDAWINEEGLGGC